MDDLRSRIDSLIKKHGLPWDRRGRRCVVRFSEKGRKQVVRVERQNDLYVFTSIVLRAEDVPGNRKLKRDLVYRAWRKNALKEMVTFSYDEEGNMVGVIQQPVSTMDDEELMIYLDVLAKEADRFEFKLTGKDRE